MTLRRDSPKMRSPPLARPQMTTAEIAWGPAILHANIRQPALPSRKGPDRASAMVATKCRPCTCRSAPTAMPSARAMAAVAGSCLDSSRRRRGRSRWSIQVVKNRLEAVGRYILPARRRRKGLKSAVRGASRSFWIGAAMPMWAGANVSVRCRGTRSVKSSAAALLKEFEKRYRSFMDTSCRMPCPRSSVRLTCARWSPATSSWGERACPRAVYVDSGLYYRARNTDRHPFTNAIR